MLRNLDFRSVKKLLLLWNKAVTIPLCFLGIIVHGTCFHCLKCTRCIKLCSRNFKGGSESLFDPCVNAMGWRPYCPSRMEVSYCTFGFGAIIRRDLRTLSLPHDSSRDIPICMHDLSPRGKGNSHLTELFGRLSFEKIRRYNNSPPYLTARWPPQQIPPLNFLGCARNGSFYIYNDHDMAIHVHKKIRVLKSVLYLKPWRVLYRTIKGSADTKSSLTETKRRFQFKELLKSVLYVERTFRILNRGQISEFIFCECRSIRTRKF